MDQDTRTSDLEGKMRELTEKYARATDDIGRLQGENQSLKETIRRLTRDAMKYEHLKRNILSAVSDDAAPALPTYVGFCPSPFFVVSYTRQFTTLTNTPIPPPPPFRTPSYSSLLTHTIHRPPSTTHHSFAQMSP